MEEKEWKDQSLSMKGAVGSNYKCIYFKVS